MKSICRKGRQKSGWANKRMIPGITKGFTLLEVIISLSVVSLTALGVMSGLTTSYSMDQDATEFVKAQNLSRHLMEELLVVSFDDLIKDYDNKQVLNSDNSLRAVLNIDQMQPATGKPSLIRMEVVVTSVANNRELSRIVTLRSDHRAPDSAWLSGL